MLVWIVGNTWLKHVPTHAISVILALVALVNSVKCLYIVRRQW